jgi:hypothetical protein
MVRAPSDDLAGDSVAAVTPQGARARLRGDAPTVVALAVALFAGASMLFATRSVVGLNPDSASYLSTAFNLVHGRGLTTFSNQPLTLFGPGFPVVVAGLIKLGLGPVQAARTFNALAFVTCVWLSFLLLRRHVTGRWTATVVTVVVAISAILLQVSAMAWSEPGFIALSLVFILVLEDVIRRGGAPRLVVLAALLASIAFLFRYAGLALVPIGVVSLLSIRRERDWRTTLRSTLSFAVMSLVIPVVWVLRNHAADGTILGPRNPASATIWFTLKGLGNWTGQWLLPVPYWPYNPTFHFTPGLLDLVGFLVLGAALFELGRQLSPWRRVTTQRIQSESSYSLVPVLSFVTLYAVYLVVSELSTALDPISARLYSPMAVPLIVLATVALSHVLGTGVVRRRSVRWAVGVVVALVLANQFYVWQSNVRHFDLNGFAEFGESYWTTSQLSKVTEDLPTSVDLYTNSPYGLWLNTFRPVVLASPPRTAWQSTVIFPVPREFVTSAACHSSDLAWFTHATPFYYTPAQLARYVRVTVVEQASDGTLYRLSAPPGWKGICRTH